MELSLSIEMGVRYRELRLQFAGQPWVCDLYYFAIDDMVLSEGAGKDKARIVLRRLLDQWLTAVENIPDGGAVYLPYDFSDQYTGWLRCSRLGSCVDVCRGWAELEGWSFAPSDVGERLFQLTGFQSLGPTVQVSLKELVEAVQNMATRNG